MACNQSTQEIKWLENVDLMGYDRIATSNSFGRIEDLEGNNFGHVPDAIALNSRSLDLYIFDHKTSELNGCKSKRTADAQRAYHAAKGNKGKSYLNSWSNSFYQKDCVQRAFRGMTAGNVYYVIVTSEMIEIKKSWKKRNPFVISITEEESYQLKNELREIELFDPRLHTHKVDGTGCVLIDLPTVDDSQEEFRAITTKGLETFQATKLQRTHEGLIRLRLMI